MYTRTLAELYASQGAVKQALEVLQHLRSLNPDDTEIARRIVELETGGAAASSVPPVELGIAARREEEVEALARDLAESGNARHEVESPFAWAEKEPEHSGQASGPTIREYFDGLLNWEPRGGA
jgi:hypothetical protein